MSYARLEQISPKFPYLNHLQVIDPLFVTITLPLSNMMGETFCEEFK